MKTKEELNEIKKELEAVREKLAELTEEELGQVAGGMGRPGTAERFVPIPFYLGDMPTVGNIKKIMEEIDDGSSQD